MSFKWRDSRTPLFLEIYKRYECLWNKNCSEYKRKNAREDAYSWMLADLNIPGLTVLDVKSKIKTVRTRYASELAKVRNSELNGDDKLYEPRLFWFKDADAFLRHVTSIKLSYSNSKDLDSEMKDSVHDKAENSDQECQKVEQQTTDDEEDETAFPQVVGISPVVTMTTTPTIETRFRKSKRLRKRHLKESVPVMYDSMKKSKIGSKSESPHEFDIFCESLAVQLKKMPLNRALLCQQKLQHVMTKERLFQLSTDSSEQQRFMMTSPSLSIQSQFAHSSEEDEQEAEVEGIDHVQVKIEK